MSRIQGKRFVFVGDERGGYTAAVGPDATAHPMWDAVGWRGLLFDWSWSNPTGIFLTPIYWRHDRLELAVRDFEAMIDDNGAPKVGGRIWDGGLRWYGEAKTLEGSLTDGSGTWTRVRRKILTLPQRKGKLVPAIADAHWHPAIAQLQILVQAAAFDVNELLRAARAGEEPKQGQFIAETLLASIMPDVFDRGDAMPPIETSQVLTLLLPPKERAERLLFRLANAVDHAQGQHLNGACSSIMSARVRQWLQQARATGGVELVA